MAHSGLARNLMSPSPEFHQDLIIPRISRCERRTSFSEKILEDLGSGKLGVDLSQPRGSGGENREGAGALEVAQIKPVQVESPTSRMQSLCNLSIWQEAGSQIRADLNLLLFFGKVPPHSRVPSSTQGQLI